MRVAIVTETFLPAVNGIVRSLLAYLDYLAANGHDAVVFAPGDGPEEYRGFKIVRVPGQPFPLYPEVILAPYSLEMRPTLQAFRPHIIHLAGPFALGKQGLDLGRERGVPVVAHYQTDIARYAAHFGLGEFAQLVWTQLFDIHNACDMNFAPTPSVLAELQARGIRNLHLSGRGVDTALFNPARRDAALRARYTGGVDRPVFIYVGRVSAEKHVALLATVAAALPDYPLVIVGDGPARADLAASLAGREVHFTGVLHGDDLAAAYASSDVFLFPSSTETFGQVVREAMASHLPAVGVRAGGVQDLITDGVTGLLCLPDDAAAFVAAARLLASDADRRAAYGSAARLEAEHYSWDAVFDELTQLYAGLIASRGAGSARTAPAG